MPDHLSQTPVVPLTGDAALRSYQRRTRRAMRLYLAVLLLIGVTVGIGVKIAYSRGEITHVSRQSAPAVSAVETAPTAALVTAQWHTDDTAAAGTPSANGLVITYSAHTVSGRDALTGAVRWFYTRTDETICTVAQQDASTIAIFNRHGNCDEVTGFVTATGAPKWYRTLMDTGITAVASAPNVVLTVAKTSVHVFDNASGLDRWNWNAPTGCQVNRALAGSLGVLIAMNCGGVHKLVFRDEISDTEKWTIQVANDQIPIGARIAVAALDPSTGAVWTYSTDKGESLGNTPLTTPAVAAQARDRLAAAATTVDVPGSSGVGEFVWLDKLYEVSASLVVSWSAAASGPPTIFGTDIVAAVVGSDVLSYAIATGQPVRTVHLGTTPPTGAAVYPLGAGLLITGAGVTFYRAA